MQDNNMSLENVDLSDGYKVFVVNISWNKDSCNIAKKYRSKKDFSAKLPDTMILDIPENIVAKSNNPDFNDYVETFVYNFLYKRFNYIANHCQIWLPCAEQSI